MAKSKSIKDVRQQKTDAMRDAIRKAVKALIDYEGVEAVEFVLVEVSRALSDVAAEELENDSMADEIMPYLEARDEVMELAAKGW